VVNGKMRTVETIPEMGAVEIQENIEGDEFKCHVSYIVKTIYMR
jgi:hypothetical protein